MAVGLFIGVLPLWGIHLPLVLAVCIPFHLDACIAYAAANISLPILAPFWIALEICIGSFVRTGHVERGVFAWPKDNESIHDAMVQSARDIAVGTSILAPVLAIVGGALALVLTKWWQQRRASEVDTFDQAVDRVASRYAKGRRAAAIYVRSKLASDPVTAAIAQLVHRAAGDGDTLGDVVDLGCGRGRLVS